MIYSCLVTSNSMLGICLTGLMFNIVHTLHAVLSRLCLRQCLHTAPFNDLFDWSLIDKLVNKLI